MALITCKNCGHHVSDLAAICPKCGHALSISVSRSSDKNRIKKAIIADFFSTRLKLYLLAFIISAIWFANVVENATSSWLLFLIFSSLLAIPLWLFFLIIHSILIMGLEKVLQKVLAFAAFSVIVIICYFTFFDTATYAECEAVHDHLYHVFSNELGGGPLASMGSGSLKLFSTISGDKEEFINSCVGNLEKIQIRCYLRSKTFDDIDKCANGEWF